MDKNVAIVGAGYWGKNLVRTFYNTGCLKIVCDKNKDLLKDYEKKYSDVLFTEDYSSIFLESNKIKSVVVSTPAEKHFEIVKDCLLFGKNVFVEKPLSLNVEDGEKLVSLAKEKNLILMVGHILQYHPAIVKLKELIDSGELGKIQYIYSNRLNFGKIRSEENILWSFAPHDISVILKLLGEFPTSVQVSGGEYLQTNIADVTISSFEFKSGVKGHVFVSWLHPFKEQKLVVVGNKKMAVFDDVCSDKLLIYPHIIDWKNGFPVASKALPEKISIEQNEPLMTECKHFIDCVNENKTPSTDGNEGLRVLRVLQACQESLNNKGKKIFFEDKNSLKFSKHNTVDLDSDCIVGKVQKYGIILI
jgi:UDP-2-acetamido-3-amino-2,3-dideoxy-glucuronate N-acetyltransferase